MKINDSLSLIKPFFLATLGIFAIFAIAVFSYIYLGAGQQTSAASTQPNIIVIMADDLEKSALESLVENGFMPNLKAHIIDKGIKFENAFVTYSLCCPSRATLLTGQYPHNHNVLTNVPPDGSILKLNASSTIATWLHDAGYWTGHVGKFLNGYGKVTAQEYVPPFWDDWQGLVDPTTYRVYDFIINDNGALVQYGDTPEEYQTDVLATRSVEFINDALSQHPDQPFFLTITPLAPHTESLRIGCQPPWGLTIRPAPRHADTISTSTIPLPQPPSFNEEDVSDKPRWVESMPLLNDNDISCLEMQYKDRLESVRAIDDLIGSVAAALGDKINSTVLVFTSDNGWFSGQHRLSTKAAPYEEGIRIPLYIRDPRFNSPATTDRFVINNDLAPTFANYARLTLDADLMDGKSLLPLIENPARTDWRKRFLVEYYTDPRMPEKPTHFSVKTAPYDETFPNKLYVEYENGEKEFYDLSLDLYQLQSEHASSTYEVEQALLSDWLAAVKKCKGVSCRYLEYQEAP